jgi:hypothetical protein
MLRVLLSSLVPWLLVVSACESDGAPPDEASPEEEYSISFMLGDVLRTFPEAEGSLVWHPGAEGAISFKGSNAYPDGDESISISVVDEPGAHACFEDGVPTMGGEVERTFIEYVDYRSGIRGLAVEGDCAVDLDDLAKADGEIWTGRFSSALTGGLRITDGVFRIPYSARVQ